MSITDTICYEEDTCHILRDIEEAKKFRDMQYREIFEEKSRTIYKALKQYDPPKDEWNRNYRIKQRNLLIKHYKEKFDFD